MYLYSTCKDNGYAGAATNSRSSSAILQFCAMRRVKSYLRSKMTQDWLNHFMIMISVTSQRGLLVRMDADNKHLVTSIDLSSCPCINLNVLKCVVWAWHVGWGMHNY